MRGINTKLGQVGLIFLLALFILGGLFLFNQKFMNGQYEPVDISDHTVKDIVIPEQSTARQIAQLLLDNDLIHSEKAFLNYCKHTGYDSVLKAGHYQFSRSQSLMEIAEAIAKGQIVTITFTIPEGYTVEQIGNLLVNRGLCTQDNWDEAINLKYDGVNFIKYGDNNIRQPLEGFLFPDTYRIPETATAQDIIEMMLKNFTVVWKNNFAIEAEKSGMSIFDIITIASMIEKEAMVGDERTIISGVINNRLKINMSLQIDATVLYALGQHKNVVLYRDLDIDSPYNTYLYPGLPAGPIASPGQAAIAAALNPQKHDYLYYVATGDGRHYFANTYEEHLRAKAKYIK